MSKGYKVRRYGYDRRQQKKQHRLAFVLMVVIITVACVAGWFLYEPVSLWIQNYAAELAQKREEAAAQKPQQPETPLPDDPAVPPAGEEPSPEQTAFPQKSTTLTTSQLMDQAALAATLKTLAAAGYDGVIFDLKDLDGQVLYQSAVEAVTANEFQTAARYDLSAVLKTIREAGLTPVGRLYAFRDRTATKQLTDAAVKYSYSKTNWLDNAASAGGKSWLNPNSTEAQDYILALLREATDAGLTQVVLDGIQFPEGYSLNLATYATQGTTVDKSTILSAFLQKAVAQGKADGCTVWGDIAVSAAAGVNTVRYGTDPSRLFSACGNVVLNVAPEQFGAGITSEGLTLQEPVKDPYGTVKAALAASATLKKEGLVLVAEVQGYTSTVVASKNNLAYSQEQIDLQIKAAEEFGIANIIVDTVA